MLSHRQYRLWVGMITEADDDGRLVADAIQLRALVFAYHPDVSTEAVADDLTAIEQTGMIHLYRIGDTLYAHFVSWRDHQRIDRPKPSQYPQPSCCRHGRKLRVVRALPSTTEQRSSGEPTSISRADLIGSDRKGSERSTTLSGGERPTMPGLNGHSPEQTALREHAKALLGFLNERTGRHYRATPTNLNFIVGRLKSGASVEDCRSIIARKVREWLTDPKMTKYLRPETLFNATKFESYIGELGS